MKNNNYPSHYSSYDVMAERKHWDPHTREIVEGRLSSTTFIKLSFFNTYEAQHLFLLCTALLDERREHIIAFVVNHFDSKLHSAIGESQRNASVPEQQILIRNGLRLLQEYLILTFNQSDINRLETETKKTFINQLLEGKITFSDCHFPVKAFVKKVLNEAVSAYYSHPIVWSEIGYGGPAYPRGYVRSEMGLTDPWEAKRSDQ